MKKSLNIHTHQAVQKDDEVRVYNLMHTDFWSIATIDGYLSVGIHPWYIQDIPISDALNELANVAKFPQTVAIGECGLDRAVSKDIRFQKEVFIAQLHIAESCQKPVIIHCVRAFEELMAIKKQEKIHVPMIVHGFNTNAIMAQQLLRHGFYLSLGAAVLNPNSHASKVIAQVPISQLFLETDTQTITIASVYERVASLRSIAVEELKTQIWENFEMCFNATS